jgi:hypothetical protein
LKNEWLGGSPCWCQSFSDSVYKTTKLGAKNPNNPRHLVQRFDEVLRKMRLEHADLISNFQSPLVVASRKTSKKKGKEGEPLTKCLRGVSIEEKDLLAADKHAIKIGMQSKKTWIDHPELFLEQVQLKFGKPGVCSSEVHAEAVASNFEELMNDNEKKTGGVHTALDNAVLIRFRVLCFCRQKRANSVAANKLNKLKRKDVLASKKEPPAKKMSPIDLTTTLALKTILVLSN